MIAYLSGGIESHPKPGVWRDNMKEFIEKELGGEARCPVEGEQATTLPADFNELRTLDPELFRALGRRYIMVRDIDLLEQSNCVILNADEYAGTGTAAEAHHAYWVKKIPVYVKLGHPKTLTNLGGWIYWSSTQIFHTWDDMKEYLKGKYGK